jgi:hypothetical protein
MNLTPDPSPAAERGANLGQNCSPLSSHNGIGEGSGVRFHNVKKEITDFLLIQFITISE